MEVAARKARLLVLAAYLTWGDLESSTAKSLWSARSDECLTVDMLWSDPHSFRITFIGLLGQSSGRLNSPMCGHRLHWQGALKNCLQRRTLSKIALNKVLSTNLSQWDSLNGNTLNGILSMGRLSMGVSTARNLSYERTFWEPLNLIKDRLAFECSLPPRDRHNETLRVSVRESLHEHYLSS